MSAAGDEPVADAPTGGLLDQAPCGLLTAQPDGTISHVNRTFERWTGLRREDVVGRRFTGLLTAGGRIFHETHIAPLLRAEGAVHAVALDIVRADGGRLPAIVNLEMERDVVGAGVAIHLSLFDSTDRRRYEQELLRARDLERDVAGRLQASLLSGELPVDARVHTEVRLRPAVRGTQVGGDWYDAFWLTPGRSVGAVVGDVVGKGIDAAAAMGQLRSAIRALASTGMGPAELLTALDRYADRHAVGRMATVAYVEVDVIERRVRYAVAGHPPPALLEPDRPARMLWDGRSRPVDAFTPGGDPSRAEAEMTVAPGSTLVLYSDGLVERRGQPLDDGLDGLLRVLEDVRGRAGDGLVDAVVRRMPAGTDDPDDICVLVLHLPAR